MLTGIDKHGRTKLFIALFFSLLIISLPAAFAANDSFLDFLKSIFGRDNKITGAAVGDVDNDGIADNLDNCPTVSNPGQLDSNNNGIGDICDPFPVGSGILGDPYQISTCQQLQNIISNISAHYILVNDIDCSDTKNWNNGKGFLQINGSNFQYFSGVLDGNGKKVTNLYIGQCQHGMIARSEGVIKNIGLINASLFCESYENAFGALVGYNRGTINNSYSTGIVNASKAILVGGLVGLNNQGGIVTNSYSSASVYGNTAGVGGLVGYNGGGSLIRNSYSRGDVFAITSEAGGLVGSNQGGSVVSNSYSLSKVNSPSMAGGLVGSNWATIENSFSAGVVSGGGAGGLVGHGQGSVINSYWNIETSGQTTSAGGTGKTTAELKQQSTFVGWDFVNVWNLIEGTTYPFITSQTGGDADSDGIVDGVDNALGAYNPDQADTDKDNIGDVIDTTVCGDGDPDPGEQCDDGNTLNGDGCSSTCQIEARPSPSPTLTPQQLCAQGKVVDLDNDGLNDCNADLCLNLANAGAGNQDPDGDMLGNACDPDDDNDGIPDAADSCPFKKNLGIDLDKDGIDEACDQSTRDGSGSGFLFDKINYCSSATDFLDLDSDTVNDCLDDLCIITYNCNSIAQCADPTNADSDGDSLGNVCDPQTCGNRIKEGTEQCDDGNTANGDGCSSTCQIEARPSPSPTLTPQQLCAQGKVVDLDNDGLNDCNADLCLNLANAGAGNQDPDGDMLGNACDPDDDNDGSLDGDDCQPLNPAVHPGATEICTDGIDNECDGLIDAFDFVDCDRTPPTTTKTLNPPVPTGQNGWFTVPFTATFACQDPQPGSGCAQTQLSVNNALFSVIDPLTFSQTFSQDGTYFIQFFSTDNVGNIEATKSQTEKLDQTPPTTTKTPVDSDGDGVEDSFTLTCSDATSGCSQIRYSIDSMFNDQDTSATFNCPVQGATSCSTTVNAPVDSFTVSFYSVDVAGLQGIQQTQTEFGDACPTVKGTADKQGCPFGDLTIINLHTIDQQKSGICGFKPDGKPRSDCKQPLANILVKVFNREDPNFVTTFTKKPARNLLDDVYEANIGLVGRCVTNSSGACINGEPFGGKFLVIAKFTDAGQTVYTGKFKNFNEKDDDDDDEKDDDDIDNTIVQKTLLRKKLHINKLIKKDGTIKFSAGFATIVKGSRLEVLHPEYTVWSGTTELYPFIFESNESWNVDVCLQVPQGYKINGVLDDAGNVISTNTCLQSLVAGESKIFVFELIQVGSPEPDSGFTLTTTDPKGKKNKKRGSIPGIRKKNEDDIEREVDAKIRAWKERHPDEDKETRKEERDKERNKEQGRGSSITGAAVSTQTGNCCVRCSPRKQWCVDRGITQQICGMVGLTWC